MPNVFDDKRDGNDDEIVVAVSVTFGFVLGTLGVILLPFVLFEAKTMFGEEGLNGTGRVSVGVGGWDWFRVSDGRHRWRIGE